MSEQNKIEILNVLNSLEIIDQNGGDDAYMLAANTPETREKLAQFGVSAETISNYGDDETFCILALAFGEGYATDYKSGIGLVYEESKIDKIKEALAAATPGPWTYSAARISGEKTTVCDVWYSHDNDILTHAPEYITYLLQEIERKDEALRFYADTKKYEQEEMWLDDDGLEKYWEEPEILGDGGKIAREAL